MPTLRSAQRTPVAGAHVGLVSVLLLMCGCSRSHYRHAADQDAYRILQEKVARTAWITPPDFTIEPDPRSRLFDPTPPDDPLLPPANPRLYDYELPNESESSRPQPVTAALVGTTVELIDETSAEALSPREIRQAALSLETHTALRSSQSKSRERGPSQRGIEQPSPERQDRRLEVMLVPKPVWEDIPIACLRRMFEFTSVRDAYEQSYGAEPAPPYRDLARRLTLEEIVQLTLINSREYQTQKELLYSAALRLSFERFGFQLKFSSFGNRLEPSGNGTAADFAHRHDANGSSSSLRVPSSIQGDKILWTGGDLIARLANDVVLTFNGPDGFAADVSSELFMNLSQTVFQRDIRFERLTQAERDVVYAARGFARFRKTLFFQLAGQYYNLLQTYRQIEIDSQNYFTLVRAFSQRAVETRTGMAPRVQLDQVEQDALRGRSRLIATCDRLERELDSLKIRMGLPPELAINLNLAELEELTLRDELAVATEQVRRARRQLETIRAPDESQLEPALPPAVALVERMLDAVRLRIRLGRQAVDLEPLQELRLRLRIAEATLAVDRARRILQQDRAMVPPHPPARLVERTLDLLEATVSMAAEKVELARQRSADKTAAAQLEAAIARMRQSGEQLRGELQLALAELELERVSHMTRRAEVLLEEVTDLDRAAGQMAKLKPESPEELLERANKDLEHILAESRRQLEEDSGGLVPVEIDTDDAMLTALFRRLDLMNERGAVADRWRTIKLTADELRSVLNFNLSQTVGHRRIRSTSADDSFAENETRLTASLDTPLNRKAQRNNFRQALINYHAALRNLMLQEDNTKLSVRNDLRDLSVTIDQYQIDIASAALARERVSSTQLQLALGVANVTARDFLEAQDAYSESLSRVATRHIGYILNRTQLFLNLELLELDENGFWRELYDERHQPIPARGFPADALLPYGTLPENVHYSEQVKRMLAVPPE